MKLTDDEARECAARLWRGALGKDLDMCPGGEQDSALKVVLDLAAKLPEPQTDQERRAALGVFTLWCGDAPPYAPQ
jgi:hypothetical protein